MCSSDLVFHHWISYDEMPMYYSLGSLSFCVGNFVESFPNVSLESLACGTPSVSSRVAAHRVVLPESIEPRVDFGDMEGIAEIAYNILVSPESFDIRKTQEHIATNFDFLTMVRHYADLISTCKLEYPLPLKIEERKNQFTLPPWCHISDQFGIYNDYQYTYITDQEIIRLLEIGKGLVKETQENKTLLAFHEREGNLVRV